MKLRVKIRLLAIGLIIGYAAVRFVFVKAFFQTYGADPFAFFLIDASTGVVYVIGIEQLIVAMGRNATGWLKLLSWAMVTALAFAAPYLYLYISSRQLPATLGIGMAVIILLLFLNALVSLRRRIRRSKDK